MLEAIPLWLHITAAAAWVGSQLLMFLVVVPSLRALPDESDRVRVLERLTPRFAWFGFAVLGLLILTGIENVRQYTPSDPFEARYGYILTIKLVMLGVVLGLTIFHTRVVGPALLTLQRQTIHDASPANEQQLRRARGRSVAISATTLLLSLAIVFCAVLLRSAFGQAAL
jgi:putative copper export protein